MSSFIVRENIYKGSVFKNEQIWVEIWTPPASLYPQTTAAKQSTVPAAVKKKKKNVWEMTYEKRCAL